MTDDQAILLAAARLATGYAGATFGQCVALCREQMTALNADSCERQREAMRIVGEGRAAAREDDGKDHASNAS